MVHKQSLEAQKKRLQNRINKKAHRILTNKQKFFDRLIKETVYIAPHETVLSAYTTYKWNYEVVRVMELKIIQPGEVLSNCYGTGSLQSQT